MTAIKLANRLKLFKVKPTQYKDSGEKLRGYRLQDLQESFARYAYASKPSKRYNPITTRVWGHSRRY